MAKSDFSEIHSKREKGLKVKRDASTELSMTKVMRKPKGHCHPERSRGISSKGKRYKDMLRLESIPIYRDSASQYTHGSYSYCQPSTINFF